MSSARAPILRVPGTHACAAVRARGGSPGFTLVEVSVALTILAVGWLGAVGTLLTARRVLGSSERLHVAAQAAAHVADSLLVEPGVAPGRRVADWGTLQWSTEAAGVRIVAEDPSGDTLLDWWVPGREPPP